MTFRRLALTGVLLLIPPSCGEEELSPEARVKAVVALAEEAVEARDLAAVKKLISEAYSDEGGNDRRAALGIVQYHFLRNESLHLLVRVDRVEFPQPGLAKATLVAAMAGEPIPTAESLGSLRADIYRFDVEFAEEDGDFRLTTARWQRAAPKDLF